MALRDLQDAKVAIDEGVDAIGLVFCENSPRYINISKAKEIVENITPFVNCVGLFVDAEKEYINDVLKEVALDTLQFHGQESEQACALYNKPYIKAIRMNENINLNGKLLIAMPGIGDRNFDKSVIWYRF